MYSKPMAGAFLALLSIASAQTHTVCDPIKKDCPPNPAFGGEIDIDYTKGKNDFFDESPGTTLTYDKEKGAVFTIENEKDAPTIESPEFIFFGKLVVELMVAPGVGVVTSVVMQSLTLDEIDWEWLGGDGNSVQTNYFSKGDTTTYDRGGTHPVSNAFGFHTYTIDWTQQSITWSIDGSVVRTLTYDEAKGGAEYPQTPMQIKLGSWVAGSSDAPQGRVDWAGGLANFDNGPSHAYYRRVSVTDYAGGAEGAKQYVYSDRSGTWQSIVIETEGGDVQAKGGVDDVDKDKDDEGSSSVAPTPSATDDITAPIRPTPSSTGEADDGGEADTGDDNDGDEGDDGEGDSTGDEGDSTGDEGDSTGDDDANTGDEDSPDAPVQEGGEGENPASGAPLSAQALTCVGAVLSGAAVFANLL